MSIYETKIVFQFCLYLIALNLTKLIKRASFIFAKRITTGRKSIYDVYIYHSVRIRLMHIFLKRLLICFVKSDDTRQPKRLYVSDINIFGNVMTIVHKPNIRKSGNACNVMYDF